MWKGTIMTFEEFRNYVRENILAGRLAGAGAEVERVLKNNGNSYWGLCIRREDEIASPYVYLEKYYEDYRKGQAAEEILERIWEEYERGLHWLHSEADIKESVDLRKEQIIFHLVNYDLNREKLKNCPHIRFLDLAVVFRTVIRHHDDSVSSVMISKRDLDRWEIEEDELMTIAMNNTYKLLPSRVFDMDSIITYFCTGDEADDPRASEEEPEAGHNMYVMTNASQLYGAAVLLYDNVLKDTADALDSDLVILPCSIHEVIAVPASVGIDKESFRKMVSGVNKDVVDQGEILSFSIYYYDRISDRLLIA